MEQKKSDGAIWKKTIKTAKGPVEILSIVIGDKRYSAWPNSYKQAGDKTPDYRIQVDNYEPKAQTKTNVVARPVEETGDLPF